MQLIVRLSQRICVSVIMVCLIIGLTADLIITGGNKIKFAVISDHKND